MNHQLKTLLLAATILMLTLACSVSFPGVSINADTKTIEGSGNASEETREVSGFSAVTLAGFGHVVIEMGEAEKLRIRADENFMPHITSEVRDGELVLGWEQGYVPLVTSSDKLEFYVTVTEIEAITLAGAGNIEAESLQAEALTIELAGAGGCELRDLEADTLNVELAGAGGLVVSGVVREQTVNLNALGGYEAKNLESESATVSLSGAGTAHVRVSESLDVIINGAGSVVYYGDPEIEQSVNGLGEVKRGGD